MRYFLILLVLAFGFAASSAVTPALAASSEDKAAFKAAYGRYNAAVEARDAEAAVTAATEALELGQRIYNDDHPNLANLYLNKGYALLESGKAKQAIKPLAEAIGRLKAMHGKKSPELIAPLWALADAYNGAGKKNQAADVYKRISPLINEWVPEDRLALRNANLRLGKLLMLSGRRMSARPHLDVALDVYRDQLEEPDTRTAEALYFLGRHELAKKGGSKTASEYLRKASEIFEAILGEDHPYYLQSSGYASFASGRMPREEACKAGGCDPEPLDADEYLALKKPPPIYPRKAQMKNIQGWVIVEFTVTKTGRTDNLRVLASDDSGLFEGAAIQAASNFRYRPQMEDGEPVDVPDVRNTIIFQMTR